MKLETKILLACVLAGIIFWGIDAVLDYVFFSRGQYNLAELLIFKVSPHELYFRIAILLFCVIFGVIVSRNITLLRQSRESVLENQERLRTTLVSIGDAVITTDRWGVVTFLNPIAEALTGWPTEEAQGQPLNRIFNIINEQTRETVENPVLRVLQSGKIVGLANHTVLISRDGTERVIADSGAPIRSIDGNITGVVLVFRDETERRQAERLTLMQHDLALALGVTTDPQEAADRVMKSLTRIQGVDSGGVYLFNEETGTLVLKAHQGLSRAFVENVSEYNPDSPQTALIQKGEIQYFTYEELIKSGKEEARQKEGLKALAILPVTHKGGVVACLNAASHEISEFPESTRHMLETMAAQFGATLARILTESALRDMEATRRTILHAAPMGIGFVNKRIVGWTNERFAQMMGYSPEEMNGMNARQFYETDEEYERVGTEKHADISKYGIGSVETRFKRKDGSVFDAILSSAAIDPEDSSKGLVFTVMDISQRIRTETELRYSEQRYHAMFDNTSSGVAVYQAVDDGEDFVFLDFNKASQRIEEITRDQAIGKRVTEIFPGVKEFGILDAFRRVWTTGEPEDLPVKLYQDDRIQGWRDNFIYKLPSGEVVAVYDDVTEQKKAEEALKRYGEQLEELVDERTRELKEAHNRLLGAERLAVVGQFSGNISHEIRNPLGVISTSAYYLRRRMADSGDEKIQKHLEQIEHQVRNCSSIIESLLRLTRMEAPRTTSMDLRESLRLGLSTSRIPEKVKMEYTPPEQPVPVRADKEQLRMVFKNIITNAVQMLPNGGLIRIHMTAQDDCALVHITDNGPGVPEEQRQQIFQPLFTTKAKGIGFGLSIAKMIMERHNGDIIVEESCEGGAEFIIRLPLARIGA